jgi:translation initiation factor IF-3
LRVNRDIRAREIRVIGPDGNQIGILPLREALRIADDMELDLVEVGPGASPPVCRLMDYGKYLYKRTKREREARKAQKSTEVKEIRLRPKTAEHDIAFKTRHIRRFLEDGNKVRVRIRFRGREAWHPEIARDLLMDIAKDVEDEGAIEKMPAMEGRSMLMILGPKE